MSDRKLIKTGERQKLTGWHVLLTCDRTGVEYVAGAGRYPDSLAKYGDKAYPSGYRVVPCDLWVTLTQQQPAAAPAAPAEVPF